MLAWRPDRVVPTHFGPSPDPAAHFAELRRGLALWAERVHASLDGDEPGMEDPQRDAQRAREFAAWLEADLRARMPADVAAAYTAAFGFEDSWWGLARYWRTRT